MKSRFKKLVIYVLCFAFIILPVMPLTASAMSISEGTPALRTLWARDNGPEKDNCDIDYSYYSPIENGADKTKKYPLVVIMAGALEGLQEGFELEANSLASWTAEEFQSEFNNGAAFLIIGRAPEEDSLYWDSSKLVSPFKAAIDDFCEKNKENIDMSRIYVIGWCLGGNGAMNLATNYPNFFAAAMIMCPNRAITVNEAKLLENMPVWVQGCKKDSYSNFYLYVQTTWNRISRYSKCKDKLRFTTYDEAPDVYLLQTYKFIENHNLWDNLAYDMHCSDDRFKYSGMETTDGNKNIIADPYAISWLTSQTNDNRSEPTDGGTPGKVYKFFFEEIKTLIRSKYFELLLGYFAKKGLI